MEFNHFDDKGNARMVDVSGKDITERRAVAKGSIKVSSEVMDAIKGKTVKKGDVLTVAQVAGIAGTKRTSDLIPMCHPLALTNSEIRFEIDEENNEIVAFCTVGTEGRTGVEMEALTGVASALLTIYDMCKAIDRGMEIRGIHLIEKSGGSSGDYHREDERYDYVVARVASTRGSTPRHSGAVMLMREDGKTSGTVGGGLLEHETEKLCRRMLRTKEKRLTYEFILDEKRMDAGALDMGCGGDATIELEYIEGSDPKSIFENLKSESRAYIFGGGHVAKALEPVLRHVGFDTWIIDDRQEYANRERFPDAAGVTVCSDFEHCFDDIEVDDDSYLIIVTRGHRGDLSVLRQAVKKPHAYLGMIGSRRKNESIFEKLREEGVSEEEIASVYAPIGLDIGSETPEEIGVSIAAEIIRVRSKRTMEEKKHQ